MLGVGCSLSAIESRLRGRGVGTALYEGASEYPQQQNAAAPGATKRTCGAVFAEAFPRARRRGGNRRRRRNTRAGRHTRGVAHRGTGPQRSPNRQQCAHRDGHKFGSDTTRYPGHLLTKCCDRTSGDLSISRPPILFDHVQPRTRVQYDTNTSICERQLCSARNS